MSDHRIIISEKLLEKHLMEFLPFTNEALGPWRREGLSQEKPRCGTSRQYFSPRGNLVRVTENLCKGKQIYYRALFPTRH